jgi:hypothetical protein
VTALLDNYRVGHDFDNLRLIVNKAGKVVPFCTVSEERFVFHIDIEINRESSACCP